MALKPVTANFESDETATAQPAGNTAPASNGVPAVATATAVSTQVGVMQDPIAALKNAMPVDYNTLAQVKCTNGNFVERETNTTLGDTIVFEVLSFQDSFVVSPNDDKAPKELVKFSDDGMYTKDGMTVTDAVAEMKADGYERAGVKQRMVVVGAIQSASKSDKYNDTPVQFDLSPETRVLFQRYQALAAYGIRTGKLTADKVLRVKAVTRLVTKGSNTYTVADFSTAT